MDGSREKARTGDNFVDKQEKLDGMHMYTEEVLVSTTSSEEDFKKLL